MVMVVDAARHRRMRDTERQRQSKGQDMISVILQYFSLSFMARLGEIQFTQLKKCIAVMKIEDAENGRVREREFGCVCVAEALSRIQTESTRYNNARNVMATGHQIKSVL